MARKTSKPTAKDKPSSPRAKSKKAGVAQSSGSFVPVVCLGASAGGLQAFGAFLDAVPPDCGAGYVMIHHVDPDHKSLMADLLTKHTSMPVVLAEEQTTVQADHVYIIPPNKYLEIKNGILYPSEPTDRRGTRLPIDTFLRSLAADLGHNAVAIILSGTGSDGSAAIREIKEQGGIVLVQDPLEAEHDGMPRSAIATGAADQIVAVAEMPDIVGSYLRHPFVQSGKTKKVLGDNAKGALQEIITALKAHSSINFDLYKEGTLLRRIERRMALRHMASSTDYLALLKDSTAEAQALCADLLISVTSFFRDSEAFDYLDTSVLEGVVKSHDPGQPLRIWVPGCATGEEAYSLAMLAIEKISTVRKDVKLQFFASDVDERALTAARNGVYPDSIAEDISSTRLNRFFTKEDHSYRVTPELRDAVVFASQNILADAPFSKLDLISCRNLMIYLTPEAQERVIQMFHFGLNDGGVLFLGMSETTGDHEGLFQPLSKKYRVYKRVGTARGRAFDFPIKQRSYAGLGNISARVPAPTVGNKLAELSQRLLLEQYAPAAVLINAKSEALYFEGPTDNYLKLPSGETSRDLLAMARQGLRARLGSVINTARQQNAEAKNSATIKREGASVAVSIHVHPVILDETKLFLVTFSDLPVSVVAAASDAPEGAANHLLEQELETTRADLRNTIRDYELSSEELKAVNEEAMSMNEEFQSTNEELETSKEELQSLNEELTTLNTQLQQTIEDERRLGDDLANLLSSSGIATLFLNTEFTIKRFTPATRDLFNLISKDIGRPFGDITSRINDPDILKDAKKVLETLVPIEREVACDDAKWFIRRILPYRMQDGKIDGVVVTFFEISDLKALQASTVAAQEYAQSIVDTVREPLLVLDKKFDIVSASKSFFETFRTKESQIIGKHLFEVQLLQWDVDKLRALLEDILPKETTVESFDLTLTVVGLGPREMVLNARRIESGMKNGEELILLALEDETERRMAERAALDRETWLSAVLDAAPEAIVTIDEAGIVSSFSPRAEAIFGYHADEVIGQNVNMLMPEPDRSKHDGYLEHYIKTGEKKIIGIGREMDAVCKDGSRVPIRLEVTELKLGGMRHFLGFLHDLTEDRKRQVELQRAQKMEAVGQLTGGLAHDFNNLLTVVIGNLELLEMRTNEPKQLELMSEALEASNLGAALTSQLLSFSKGQTLAPEHVALNELVKTMRPLLERTIDEQIRIKTQLAEDLSATRADRGKIESAILNLAINARDAMPNGGTLTIETRNVELDEAFAATQIDVIPGDYVCLSFTDTGDGMEPDVQSRAFEPFFTTKGPGAGSGLGLSMVYGFAKQSGGHIAIVSEVGLGTTVNLFLPVAAGSSGTGKAAAPLRQVAETQNETILVVEDDPKVRRLTVARLKELKYSVIAAPDGPKAMVLLKKHPEIDLVLSDIVMPNGMTGFDVATKALALRPDLKILLATGYAKGVEPEDGVAERRILRKPYGLKELARTLRELLD